MLKIFPTKNNFMIKYDIIDKHHGGAMHGNAKSVVALVVDVVGAGWH